MVLYALQIVNMYHVKYLALRHNKRTGRPIFTLSLFCAKRQAGKL